MSSLPSYYQDELSHLRELGREFARLHPGSASHLSEDGSDPDVERLLEGFAFLTSRVRQKLADDLPEISHALLDRLWPGFLRPIPSMTMMQFTPASQAREAVLVPRGALVESVPLDGTRCGFRTAYDTEVTPLRLTAVELVPDDGGVRMGFQLPEGASVRDLGISRLRLHLSGSPASARWLRWALLSACRGVRVVVSDTQRTYELGIEAIQPVGFAREHALLPDEPRSLPALRLLQEHFAFPEKFLFVDIVGLDSIAGLAQAPSFALIFRLDRIPVGAPSLSDADIALNCTPAVNLFAGDADPIHLDHRRVEHRIRVAGSDPAHAEVFSVGRVVGTARGGQMRAYECMDGPCEAIVTSVARYQLRRTPSLNGIGTDVSILFGVDPSSPVETMSIGLSCSNRGLPANLGIGDVKTSGRGVPSGVRCSNRTRPTASLPPPLGVGTGWVLLSHLATSMDSLLDADALTRLLSLHDRRQSAAGSPDYGILAVRGERSTRLVDGLPVRGIAIDLTMGSSGTGHEGCHLLVSVLDELFSQSVSLNSFSQVTVIDQTGVVRDRRPARLGTRTLV
ncbi:MAG: type VI secretion system baseplate subunit TssF [Planctomycetes bacterium]|nr:type VI secretion system baseplate subunit TssF [Planctomycetota bacterium]